MADETKETKKNQEKPAQPGKVSKKLVSKRNIPYTPEKVLTALMKTYPDDFPWNGVELLEGISGGEVITVSLTREMS